MILLGSILGKGRWWCFLVLDGMRCMDAWMHGCMDAWMHGCMYVWMDEARYDDIHI